MRLTNISRRSLLAGATFAATDIAIAQNTATAQNPAAPQAAKTLTAAQVIERIKAHVGIPWREHTVDNIIAGAPETPVRGIATTMMATLDVVQRAAAAGRNMVITHESTFFSHQDSTSEIAADETYQFKLDFLRRHDMVVFHFHDHWHGHRPDGIATGMARELGWEKYADADNPRRFTLPPTTLARLASQMESRLKIRTMRVVGDPKLAVSRVIASWGYVSQMPGIPLLARPDIDVLVVGETREWELVEYAQDMIASGKKKALILLGHVVSEQAGMNYCAEWLRSFIPEIPVDFVAAAEPFWRPGKPVA
jgi:putative NIF3 family GTP cyclohydrolase 1 type 2